MEEVVRITNLVKRFGSLAAVDHFNLSVCQGEILGLLGPNGSGKSTTLLCMLSLLEYDKGEVQIFGEPMTQDSYHLKRDIGVVLQNIAVFDKLTVEENIDYFCSLYQRDKKERRELVNRAVDFAGLAGCRKSFPAKLSHGLQRRLHIACGIVHEPRLIVMDEPTVAVDPVSRLQILDGIKQLNQKGATIIYTTHYMEEAEQLCSRIAIMDRGRILAVGTADELKGMIKTGETIRAEIEEFPVPLQEKVNGLPWFYRADFDGSSLTVRFQKGKHNLLRLVNLLQEEDCNIGRVVTELPSLNDVFLEMTGRQIQDEEERDEENG